MKVEKAIAIVAAIAINCAVLAWFNAWSAAAVAAATSPVERPVVTLPVITVHPSARQLRELRRPPGSSAPTQAGNGGGAACLVMPYYSFATQCDATTRG